jgi:ParB family transcriptional regulator, chromosome partitioning protein
MSKKALGKGIGALLANENADEVGQSSLELNIKLVKPNPHQPRKIMVEDSLKELAASIKEKGIIQPVLVEKNNDDSYTIIAGERRFRAAKLAGLERIPVIVKSLTETEKMEYALIENIQREDLTPIEEAAAYESLLKLSAVSQEELAKHLGKNRSTIANSLRLLKLPQKMIDALNERKMSAGHARAILSIGSIANQVVLYKSIVNKGMSVREAEALALKLNSKDKSSAKKNKPPTTKSGVPELEDLKQQLIDHLGTKVEISGNLKQGKIEISYYSSDDLERVYDLLLKK